MHRHRALGSLRATAVSTLVVLAGVICPGVVGAQSHGEGPGITGVSSVSDVAGRTVTAPAEAAAAAPAPAAAPAAAAPAAVAAVPVEETAPRTVARLPETAPVAETAPTTIARPQEGPAVEVAPVEAVAGRVARPGPGLELARVLPKAGEGLDGPLGVWPPLALALAALLLAALGLAWPRLRRRA
jgi:hypothetical protein